MFLLSENFSVDYNSDILFVTKELNIIKNTEFPISNCFDNK